MAENNLFCKDFSKMKEKKQHQHNYFLVKQQTSLLKKLMENHKQEKNC